jgi:hypothetical protein
MKASCKIIFIVTGALIFASCATKFNGIKPASPKAYKPAKIINAGMLYQYNRKVPKVESLQPTLVWKSAGDNQTTYDLVIYTGVLLSRGDSFLGGEYLPPSDAKLEKERAGIFDRGMRVYYREGIQGTSNHVDEPLLPDKVYVWSVRIRTGTNVTAWSTYNFKQGWFGPEFHNAWWPFRTPKQ